MCLTKSSLMFLTFGGKRTNYTLSDGDKGNQRLGAESLWDPVASYIFHMSSITQHRLAPVPMGVNPFNHSTLMGWQSKTSEHLDYIPSVWWETGRRWEAKWKTDTEKDKRQKKTELAERGMSQLCWKGQSRPLFLCSLIIHDTHWSNAQQLNFLHCLR